MSNVTLWCVWGLLTVGLGTLLAFAVPTEESATELSRAFLPGTTTHGHYQIELKCAACHEPGGGVREESCRDCHAAELKAARDTHPESKFRDPAKAVLLEKFDARLCTSCHAEHVPERTHPMGLTIPTDYCFTCHESIYEDRPSHADFTFDSCATAGCHNYHDNSALYENFLLKHASEPEVLDAPGVPLLTHQSDAAHPLTREQYDAFSTQASGPLLAEWADSAHARAGVNCSNCHRSSETGETVDWSDTVTHQICRRCHSSEVDGFLSGRHGMRLAAGLSPMTPVDARHPMIAGSAHRELTCSACHPAHSYDTAEAAVVACVGCHDDQHSREYAASPHYQLWLAEVSDDAPAGSGVSCATCHMPRVEDSNGDVVVSHNQNDNLRPNEKMIRTVCLNCHGLQFSLDALADRQLKDNCYATSPDRHIRSIDMATEWFEKKQRKRSERQGQARASP